MSPLSSDDRRALLELARRAVVEAVLHAALPESPKVTGALAEPAAAFVGIHIRGRLRGCIGQTEAAMPLAETVVRCAACAAREDPRFRPIDSSDLDGLEIEISVLSAMEAVTFENIEIGRHGLMIEQGPRHGLLLPQVAVEHKLSTEQFLEAACEKAGLPRGAWKDALTRILGFTAEVFSDERAKKE